MMPATDSPERPGTKAPGRLSKALIRLLMKRAAVVASERLADGFRLITLEGAALKGVAWTPGQKVQVAMGSAFVARTYTPIVWDASTGRTCLLGYAHGDGPGSAWVRTVTSGDECDILGPRGSLDLARLTGPLAIFGDETSIGLAHAAVHHTAERSVACHFEVDDVARAGEVAAQLAIRDAALFAKDADNAHLVGMADALAPLADAGASFVLTGRASTIQSLRSTLRHLSVPVTRIMAKAYWAPGKTGLD